VRRACLLLLVVLAAAGWGSGAAVPPGALRAPDAKTNMDTNPANLASAAVTHAFGQLPDYIDNAGFRLLPFDPFRAAQPGVRTLTTYRVTVPRTSLVLDTSIVSALTEGDARRDARQYAVGVSLDGRRIMHPESYWVFYRNNGPLICRIYFPGDLGSLNMGVNSLVFNPLSAGMHRLSVVVRTHRATLVTEYVLQVLRRGPSARERASAPPDDADPSKLGNEPLAFRTGR
jgi:hypothetical protein